MDDRITAGAPITLMFSDRVKPGKTDEYENWLQGVHSDVRTFDGFLDVDIIKPSDPSNPEYITLLKFDNQANVNAWTTSQVHTQWMVRLQDLIAEHDAQQASGIELWFDRPKALVSEAPPAFWKQVVLSILVVYPSILLLGPILDPINSRLNDLMATLVTVAVLSILLTYPLMPWASKLLRNWLYPQNKDI
ncbi:antibiotic biosynthesis monooxygenase [Rhodobacteraceae bacterium M382]|nr:antibiotic biosynthesis monooxygenase [Rhodobacteraceae bacterium M382]